MHDDENHYTSTKNHYTSTKNHYTSVKNHYDDRAKHAPSIRERAQLPMIQLLLANNRVKGHLISKYLNEGESIFDMCCGKGGDAHRIAKQNPGRCLGVDISPRCIDVARGRHDKQYGHIIQYHVGDVTNRSFWLQTPPFDVLSSQFCLGYIYPDLEIEVMLRYVNKYWIGTIVDDEELAYYKNNNVASIHAYNGKTFTFHMPPCVINAREFVVPWHTLCKRVEACGFTCIESKRFHRYHMDQRLSTHEKAVHRLYRTFVFKRNE